MRVGLSVVFCATSLLTISLLALESFASPLPAPGRQCILNFCPNFADFPSRGRIRPSPTQVLLKTNGQRLAFGLAPKPPLRRPWSRKGTRCPILSFSCLISLATPTSPQRRQEVSPLPFAAPPVQRIERCGIVDIRNENGTSVGYVGQESVARGRVSLNDTLTSALPICFTSDSDQVSVQDVFINMGVCIHDSYCCVDLPDAVL